MRRLQHERGSATLELVIWAPVLLIIASVILLAGRVAQASQTVEVAATEAARAASSAATVQQARSRALDAAEASLASSGLRCGRTAVDVDTSQWRRPPGTPARVQATISCDVSLGDLAIPLASGTRTVTGRASSAIDTYRQRP